MTALRTFRTLLTGATVLSVGLVFVAGCAGATGGAAATPVPEPSRPLQFSTLSRIDTPTGGVESEILVAQTASREEVIDLLEYIRHVAVPDRRLRIRVFDSPEVWETNRRCVMAWKDWPPDRGGTAPECEEPPIKVPAAPPRSWGA